MNTPSGEGLEHSGRWLRVVRRDDFSRMMGRAIEAALVRRGGLAPERARVLRADALERFRTLFGLGTRRVRALTRNEVLQELERTHGELLRRRQQWNGELDGLERELARARTRDTTESVLSGAEETALEGALAADLERLLTASAPKTALAGVLERERQRRAEALAGVVRRERERIDQLERRVSKLRAEVERMERQLTELAQRAELDPGLPSIYDSVQGLPAEEADRVAKARMLTVLFEQNLALQQRGA